MTCPRAMVKSLWAPLPHRHQTMLAIRTGGFLHKFADSLVIGFFPLYFLPRGRSLFQVGLVVGVHAWVWSLGQVATGARADRISRRPLISTGILVVGVGVLRETDPRYRRQPAAWEQHSEGTCGRRCAV